MKNIQKYAGFAIAKGKETIFSRVSADLHNKQRSLPNHQTTKYSKDHLQK